MDQAFLVTDPIAERKRLLLVEDYAVGRRVTAMALARWFTVTAFPSGEEALRQAIPGGFDAVLTDQRMPAMTGIELLEQLRVLDPQLRRVLMSGTPVLGLAGQLATGVLHAFLLKPFTVSAALHALGVGATAY